jgi:hypothetical protein
MSHFDPTPLIIGSAVSAFLRWVYSFSAKEAAQHQGDDVIFPATKPVAVIRWTAITGACCSLAGMYWARHDPQTIIFLVFFGVAFLVMGLMCRSIPIVLSRDGIHGQDMVARRVFIPWSRVTKITFNARNGLTMIHGNDGSRILQGGFHADPEGFRRELQLRAPVPITAITP